MAMWSEHPTYMVRNNCVLQEHSAMITLITLVSMLLLFQDWAFVAMVNSQIVHDGIQAFSTQICKQACAVIEAVEFLLSERGLCTSGLFVNYIGQGRYHSTRLDQVLNKRLLPSRVEAEISSFICIFLSHCSLHYKYKMSLKPLSD